MCKLSSFVVSIALLSISSTVVAVDPAVSFDTPVYNLGMPVSPAGAGDPVCIQGDGLLVSNCDGAVGPPGPGAGSFSKSIHAGTCVAQGAISGAESICGSANVLRTEGDSTYPCSVRGGNTRTTYLCHVDLPSGALIDQVTVYGNDPWDDGYFEASIWRSLNSSFGVSTISPTFGGIWQNSGVAATPYLTNFPIYLDSDPPHIVDGNYKYVIGFATLNAVDVYSFTIDYTILP